MSLWSDLEAVAAGKACWVPAPKPELGPEVQAVFEFRMREADRLAERLRAERGA